MKPMLRVALLAAAVIALTVTAAQATEPTLEGMYGAEGINSDGSQYRAVVQIVRRGDSFLVAWIFPYYVNDTLVLVPTSAGVGVSSSGTLAVSYYGQDVTGVALYRIENDGQLLSGRWVAATGGGAIQLETLTKLATPVLVPETDTPLPPTKKSSRRPGTRAVAVRR